MVPESSENRSENRIAVVGAGLMGRGIAQSFLMAGYPVRIFDANQETLEAAPGAIAEGLEEFRQAGLIDQDTASDSLSRLTLASSLSQAVSDADFIVEAVSEDLSLKMKIFEEIERGCRRGAIIATNTSSLLLDEIGARVNNKARLVVTHWFNPAAIVPVVEVVPGADTSPETVDRAVALLASIRKTPIRLNAEVPGFLVNRIQLALLREIYDLIDKGVATGEQIDAAVMGSIGLRWASIGPLQSIDVISPQVHENVAKNLFPVIANSTQLPESVRQRMSDPDRCLSEERPRAEVDFDALEARRDRKMLEIVKRDYW